MHRSDVIRGQKWKLAVPGSQGRWSGPIASDPGRCPLTFAPKLFNSPQQVYLNRIYQLVFPYDVSITGVNFCLGFEQSADDASRISFRSHSNCLENEFCLIAKVFTRPCQVVVAGLVSVLKAAPILQTAVGAPVAPQDAELLDLPTDALEKCRGELESLCLKARMKLGESALNHLGWLKRFCVLPVCCPLRTLWLETKGSTGLLQPEAGALNRLRSH